MKIRRELAAIPIRVEPMQQPMELPALTVAAEALLTAAQLLRLKLGREPVMVAWGAGRDSTKNSRISEVQYGTGRTLTVNQRYVDG